MNSVKWRGGCLNEYDLSFMSVCRFRGAESSGPDPPVEVLLAGDPDVGPDVAVGGPSWKTHLLSRLQTQQVSPSG